MSNFIDHKMTARASTQFRRVITGSTNIVPLANGKDRRNAAWKFKRMRFMANFAMLDQTTRDEVAGAFYACNAQLLLFRFRDYGDYQVTKSPLVTAAVVGTRTPVQLTKRYSFGTAHADRNIQALSGTPVVYNSVDATVAGVFDMQLGTFTPTANWGASQYTWSGTFDCWVRFNSDEFDATMVMLDISTTDVELIEGDAVGDASGS